MREGEGEGKWRRRAGIGWGAVVAKHGCETVFKNHRQKFNEKPVFQSEIALYRSSSAIIQKEESSFRVEIGLSEVRACSTNIGRQSRPSRPAVYTALRWGKRASG